MKRSLLYGCFFLFQMFGAVISAQANNYIMVGWCTGWATYAIIQLQKDDVKEEDK